MVSLYFSPPTRSEKLGGWWIIPWTKALAAHLSSKPFKHKGKKMSMEFVALEAAMKTNAINKNPLPAFQIRFIIMGKLVIFNVDWLLWMMSVLQNAVTVYPSYNRQDRDDDIHGHDSPTVSVCCVVTLSSRVYDLLSAYHTVMKSWGPWTCSRVKFRRTPRPGATVISHVQSAELGYSSG